MDTTLITSAGSAAAAIILERLRAAKHRIVACDIYPREWNIAPMEADIFFQAIPATNASAYLAQLSEAVRQYRIDYILPLTDVEVDALCSQKERFAALGCTVCVPDEAVAQLCRDKMTMAKQLEEHGVCTTIPTFSPYGYEPGDDDFPMLLKPLRGRSSQGLSVVNTRDAFFATVVSRDDYIAQPYLSGDVLTVDVARDCFGNVQTLARRELLRTVNGLGTTVKMLVAHPLNAVCKQIAEYAGIVGVVNMEFIEHKDDLYFLEVNPRFSGGVGFSVAAGVDFPALDVACYRGESIGERGVVRDGVMTRRIGTVCTFEG